MQILAEWKRTDVNVQITHKLKAKYVCTYLQDWIWERTDYTI